MQAASFPTQIVFPRLEYGKFAANEDGAVEPGEGHQALGYSQGFPAELVGLCSPGKLSLGVEARQMNEESILTRERREGVVIRPIRLRGRFGRLGYRVGIRSEGGQKETRYYTVARYVYDECCVSSPFEMYRSIGRFTAIRRNELIEPMSLQRDDAMPLELPEHPLLLDGALASVMSGLPVGIATENEGEFFRLVDEVCSHLPDEVLPMISAGWNVSAELARSLCFAFCARGTASQARYDTTSRKWQRGPTIEIEKLAGWQYMQSLQRCNAGLLPGGIETSEINASKMGGKLGRIKVGNLADLPVLSDECTRQFFADVARWHLNQPLLSVVAAWVDGFQLRTNETLTGIVSQLASSGLLSVNTFERFCHAATSEVRARRNQLVWEYLKHSPALLDRDLKKWPSELELLSAIRLSDSGRALQEYVEVAEAGRSSELPPESIDDLADLLQQTLEPKFMRFHDRLLGKDPLYTRWPTAACENAALSWALSANALTGSMISRLKGALGDPSENHCMLALAALFGGELPTADAQSVVEGLGAEAKRALAFVLERRLQDIVDQASDVQLETIVAWARCFPAESFKDQLLRAATGQPVDYSELVCFCKEYRLDAAPTLLRVLSETLFNRVPDIFSNIVKDRDQLRPLLKVWPRDVLRAFSLSDGLADTQPSSEVDPVEIVPTPSHIATVWGLWRDQPPSEERERACEILCQWCANLQATARSTLPWVSGLQATVRGTWLNHDRIEWKLADEVSAIITCSSVKIDGRNLWSTATKTWQMLFLLRLFPDEEYRLTADQCAVLGRDRKEIVAFCRDTKLNSAMDLCLKPFLLDYQLLDQSVEMPDWKPDYERTVLWIPYRKEPGSDRIFEEALNAYTENDGQKAALCSHLLEIHRWQGESERTVWAERIVRRFVKPQVARLSEKVRDGVWKVLNPDVRRKWRSANLDLRLKDSPQSLVQWTERIETFEIDKSMFLLLFELAIELGGSQKLGELVEMELKQ